MKIHNQTINGRVKTMDLVVSQKEMREEEKEFVERAVKAVIDFETSWKGNEDEMEPMMKVFLMDIKLYIQKLQKWINYEIELTPIEVESYGEAIMEISYEMGCLDNAVRYQSEHHRDNKV